MLLNVLEAIVRVATRLTLALLAGALVALALAAMTPRIVAALTGGA